MAAKGRGVKTGCNVGVDTTDPALPVAGTGKLSEVRKSRNARRRAGVLIALHLVIAAHATHFLIAGRTLSPVEPSEAMYTLELGEVNAGFIFLLAALLATLVFGRFVCGWGCHIVAVQDLCGFIMKKLGIRPRPFRSRLLLWVPLGLAFYMFVLPTLLRWAGIGPIRSFPGFSNHLMTTGFWDTFPGPVFAVLTILTCGFAAVYLLGAKGFCSYGCPYGGLFVLMDRLSPGSIVVDDSCEQCGHCTATCTSNVVVHEEVRLYGQVVDPGCMKCMDCVSVCPKEALYFGWGRPAALARPRSEPATRPPGLSRGEELLLGVAFVVFFFAYRSLYGLVPFLLGLGWAAVGAYLTLQLWRLVTRANVRIRRRPLKLSGRLTTGGWTFGALMAVLALLTAHSLWVQSERFLGDRAFAAFAASGDPTLAATARHRLERLEKRALLPQPGNAIRLATLAGATGDAEGFAEHARTAIARNPTNPTIRRQLADHLVGRGDDDAALELYRDSLGLDPNQPRVALNAGLLLAGARRFDEARDLFRSTFTSVDDATAAELAYNLALAEVALGSHAAAITALERALELRSDYLEARENLAGLYCAIGRFVDCIREFRAAIAQSPEDPETRLLLARALLATGDLEGARAEVDAALVVAPDDLATLQMKATLEQVGSPPP